MIIQYQISNGLDFFYANKIKLYLEINILYLRSFVIDVIDFYPYELSISTDFDFISLYNIVLIIHSPSTKKHVEKYILLAKTYDALIQIRYFNHASFLLFECALN